MTAGPIAHMRADFDAWTSLSVDLPKTLNWTVAGMAARAHLSPSRFSAIYRRCFDVSPMEDLIRSRLNRAAWQLANTTMPVGAVAHSCGFENIYYFSRLFHRRFGHPPSQHGR